VVQAALVAKHTPPTAVATRQWSRTSGLAKTALPLQKVPRAPTAGFRDTALAMSLNGNLRTMPLPDILQWAAGGRKTGTLHIERLSIRKRIHLRDGLIFSSWSNDPRESLGQFLIRLGLVTEEQLFKALLIQEEKGLLLGFILADDGTLNEEQLRTALKVKAEETIYDLFLWPEGRFEFREAEVPPELLVTCESAVTPVIMEGIRRVDEWMRIREVFPSLETTFRTTIDPATREDPTERRVLELAAEGRSLFGMSLELRRSEFETAAVAFSLHSSGALEIAEARGPDLQADPVGAIQALLALAYQRLQERRYDAATKAYMDVLALDRLNQNAKKGLLAATEARDRQRADAHVPLDGIPVLAMDLAHLTRETFDPHEGFVLSRINGQWDVRSILKVCPMAEPDALAIFARLLDRKAIEFTRAV
jgi:hypothetical protein